MPAERPSLIDLYNQLSRFPSGLLRWFGIPSGANPNNIAAYYQPILDMWDHLTQSPENQQLFLSPVVNVGAGGLGSFVIQTISDFIWIPPQGLTLRTTPLAAGVNFTYAASAQWDLTTGVETLLAAPAGSNGAAANEFVVSGNVTTGFYIGGRGAQQSAISCFVLENTAAVNTGIQLSLRYVNLTRPGQFFV